MSKNFISLADEKNTGQVGYLFARPKCRESLLLKQDEKDLSFGKIIPGKGVRWVCWNDCDVLVYTPEQSHLAFCPFCGGLPENYPWHCCGNRHWMRL